MSGLKRHGITPRTLLSRRLPLQWVAQRQVLMPERLGSSAERQTRPQRWKVRFLHVKEYRKRLTGIEQEKKPSGGGLSSGLRKKLKKRLRQKEKDLQRQRLVTLIV